MALLEVRINFQKFIVDLKNFSVLPNTPHPLEKTDYNRLVEIAATFFED
jgi:hypothetical protein